MEHLFEYLIGGKKMEKSKYNYFPKNVEELKTLIKELIKERGNNADLNDIDTSEITNMYALFKGMDKFNGDISRWDTGKVTNMSYIFSGASSFNQDISKWNTGRVVNMRYMFYDAKNFDRDISKWNISKVINTKSMFEGCPIKEKNKPTFKR